MIQQSALPFKLKRGQERITSRSGLALYAEFMKAMKVRALIDGYFPPAGSGHSYSASEYIIPISLMLYGGGESIEDVREIRGDAPLRKVSGLTGIPGVSAMGDWLRRMGGRSGVAALARVNERLFCEIMRRDRGNDYTLIVDPALIEAGKRETHRTYLGYKGYRPVVATIKEVGTVVAYEFKEGTWKPFRTRDGVMTDREIAQTIHITEKGKESFRLIVLRWRENQGELFRNNYRYHCLATNMLEQSNAEMVWTYNERASISNMVG
ncbi:MAG: hypothetical protein WAW31_01375 [Smithella sp.]